jgi:hypothetical protein
VTLNFTGDQLQAVDAAIGELETQPAGLIALSKPQKQSLRKMGDKSEAFCHRAIRVLEQNPLLAPRRIWWRPTRCRIWWHSTGRASCALRA